MVTTKKWSDGSKNTAGKNVHMNIYPHERGGLWIRVNESTNINLGGKLARQIYQVLKKHYEG